MFFCNFLVKSNRLLIDTSLDNLIQTFKCSTTDKEDIRCINLNQFLMWMLSSALWRYISNRTFQNLQQCLLHTLARYITGNGWILGFSGNLVDLINVDNAILCTLDVSICCLNDLQKNILYIFSDISRLCQSCCISNGKWHIQYLRQRLCQKCLTTSGRSQHQNITLIQFHAQIFLSHNTFIVIIHRYRENLFCLFLTDHILIKKCFDFFWFVQCNVIERTFAFFIFQFFFQYLRTNLYTFITDVRSRRSCDQLANLRLWFVTK